MEFPITVESQEDFDKLVQSRLNREKTKQTDLEQQIETLTAEKQELETKATESEARATTAETKLGEIDAATEHASLVDSIAKEFKLDAATLRGSNEEELRAHAEVLKPIIHAATGRMPDVTKTPSKNENQADEREAVRNLFGSND